MKIDGKVALITGACGGIGRALTRRLAQDGAQVIAADLTPSGSMGAHAPEGEAEFRVLDVTCEGSVKALARHVKTAHGKLDILVNAAGIEIEKTVEDTSLAEWNRLIGVNVTGTFLTSKYCLPLLRAAAALNPRAGAAIVNFGSYDGFIADPNLAAYCASKGAVHALTRAMACDHGPQGVRVNAVCPGFIDTPMMQRFAAAQSTGEAADDNRWHEAAQAVHPIRRYGTPKDVANLVAWLASDEAGYASGQLWVLDGGLSAQVQQMRL